MAALSIVLGVLSLACMALGVMMTLVPVFGALLLFAAPAVAITGMIVGGIAMSRAKRAPGAASGVDPGAPAPASGRSSAALVGVIISALALLPALLSALTCGICSALLANGHVEVHGGGPRFDLGMAGAAAPTPARPARDAGQSDDDAPPPAFPAPPLKP